MIVSLLAAALAVSAIQDTTSALPGTALRFGMESSRFGAAQGFQPAPGGGPAERQQRTGAMRFFGIGATATLSFLDRHLVQAEFVVENASPRQITYIDDDLRRRGYRRACAVREPERSRCTWTGGTHVDLAREGARITATIRPLTREERTPEAPVAAAPDTMTILPGILAGDSVSAQREVWAGPVYPEEARQAGVQGVVRVHALIDTTGAVTEMRLARSIPELDEAAMTAVRQWRFRPFEANGRRVGAWVEIPVRFTLH